MDLAGTGMRAAGGPVQGLGAVGVDAPVSFSVGHGPRIA